MCPLKNFFHIYGRSKRTCGRRKINIPECDRTKMYRTFNTEFYKYIPSKDYKAFTANLKKIYRAPSLKAAENEFEKFKQTCLFCHTVFCHPDFNQMHNNTCRLKSVSDFTYSIIL